MPTPHRELWTEGAIKVLKALMTREQEVVCLRMSEGLPARERYRIASAILMYGLEEESCSTT